LCLPLIKRENSDTVTLANGKKLQNVTHKVVPRYTIVEGKRMNIEFEILDHLKNGIILGIPWLKQAEPNINWKQRTIEFMEIGITKDLGLPKELREFEDIFEKKEIELPEHKPWDHAIPIQEGKQPKAAPLYSVTYAEQQLLREFIEENLKRNFIKPSQSPVGYPVLFVPKKGEDKPRLCIDYRRLNEVTIKNAYPLPRIDEIWTMLTGSNWYTKIDIKEAYYHVRIKEGDEWKTAFRTKFGLYEFNVMSFGLMNAPATFQELINDTIRPAIGIYAVAYLDDILIYSKTREEHTKHCKQVMTWIREKKLRAKFSKCEFYVKKTNFLGHVITPGNISMDMTKVESILTWPEPKNLKELQSFLGLGNYYRQFIRDYSKKTHALHALLKKDTPWKWDPEQQGKAFQALKNAFAEEPVRQTFDWNKKTTIETDASDFAIGAVLHQPDMTGKLRPVAYHSRKMIQAELNYDVYDKELLAIVEALKTWRVYTTGSKHLIDIFTDHKNLTFFTTTKELTRRQIRWSERLAEVDFKILHTKGTENLRADALSRRPDYDTAQFRTKKQLFQISPEGNLEYANKEIAAIYKVSGKADTGILEAYKTDTMYQELKARKDKDTWIVETSDGYLRYYAKVYVPASQEKRIMQEAHDAIGSGHPGIKKTHDKLRKYYYFPQMRRKVKEYVGKCMECALNKPTRHQPYGEMDIPVYPDKPWEVITMDFILGLPESQQPMTKVKFDAILTVQDRLTKYTYFIPYKETSTAEDLAYWFIKEIASQRGMPKAIISDRDKLFGSKFWTSLMNQMGVKRKMSTAYHPQTNGQTERANQTVKQYLRFYMNYQQDNWVNLLPMAQYAYNDATHEATGETPFFLNSGYETTINNEPRMDEYPADLAQTSKDNIRQLHQDLQQDLQFTAYKMKKYYDRNRLSEPTFEEGDLVLLSTKNLKSNRPNKRLDQKRIGPFRIKTKKGPLVYELELPKGMNNYPVFHVSLLEPAPEGSKEADAQTFVDFEDDNDETIYEVEKIQDHKKEKGNWTYLIKWKNYPESENTWEPRHHIKPSLVRRYHQTKATGKQHHQTKHLRPEPEDSGDLEISMIGRYHPKYQKKETKPLQQDPPQNPQHQTPSRRERGLTPPAPTFPLPDVPEEQDEQEASFYAQEPLPLPLPSDDEFESGVYPAFALDESASKGQLEEGLEMLEVEMGFQERHLHMCNAQAEAYATNKSMRLLRAQQIKIHGYLQSSSVTKRSHLRPRETHSTHSPESERTQGRFAFEQAPQSDIARPEEAARRRRKTRLRSVDERDFGFANLTIELGEERNRSEKPRGNLPYKLSRDETNLEGSECYEQNDSATDGTEMDWVTDNEDVLWADPQEE
jgi:hypothetical protein